MVVLDVSIVNVALPSIATSLGFSSTALQWVINAYNIAFGGFLLLAGRAADLYGRKRTFLVGVGLFAVASLAGGLAPSSGFLIGARVVQGLSAAVLSAAALTILISTFTNRSERARALAAWGAAAATGGAAGTLLGGVLTDLLSWRWILLINVPVGIAMATVAWKALPSGRDRNSTGLDLAGAASATVGIGALVFGVVQSSTHGWLALATLIPLVAALAILGLFVWIEARSARSPMLPLALFRARSVSVGNVLMGLVGATSVSMWFFISLYLQKVLRYDPLQAGLAIAPFAVVIAVASRLTPRLMTRIGAKRSILAGSVLAAVGFGWWSALGAHSTYLADVVGPGILAAAGTSGLVLAPIAATVTAQARSEESGIVSGLANATRMIGGAIGLAVLTTIAAGHTKALHGAHHAGAGARRRLRPRLFDRRGDRPAHRPGRAAAP